MGGGEGQGGGEVPSIQRKLVENSLLISINTAVDDRDEIILSLERTDSSESIHRFGET